MKATYIYFMKCGEKLKIGKSNNVSRRLSQLQGGNPKKVELLFSYLQKNESDEKALHRRFSELHHVKEWFSYSGKLKGYVEELRSMPKIGDIASYWSVDRSSELGCTYKKAKGVCVAYFDGCAVMVDFDYSENAAEIVYPSRFKVNYAPEVK